MAALHDMHCHLSFPDDGAKVAQQAQAAGVLLFSNTVTPAEWQEAQGEFAPFPNVAVGFGAHPWWAHEVDSESAVELLAQSCPRFIGEVGLDFGKGHGETRDVQAALFRRIMQWAGHEGGRIISIHAVKAASQVLEILGESGALDSCTCIFHWYSGPSDVLKRAIDAGCLFSAGPRMLGTRRGAEYARAIPAGQLLLETDLPPQPGEPCSLAQIEDALRQAAGLVASLKGAEAAAQANEHAAALLGGC